MDENRSSDNRVCHLASLRSLTSKPTRGEKEGSDGQRGGGGSERYLDATLPPPPRGRAPAPASLSVPKRKKSPRDFAIRPGQTDRQTETYERAGGREGRVENSPNKVCGTETTEPRLSTRWGQRVTHKAGKSLRAIFPHFSSREGLCTTPTGGRLRVVRLSVVLPGPEGEEEERMRRSPLRLLASMSCLGHCRQGGFY